METTPTLQKRPQILVVDDEVAMVRSLELLLRPLGDIHKAYSVPEAEEFMDQKMDCIVTDVSMPEASGMTLVEKVRKKNPETPVIVMTAYSSVDQAVEAMQRGAFKYIVKPFENADMLGTVKKAITKKGLVIGETKKLPEGWICNSPAMAEFLKTADRIAKGHSPVLILGEHGVGKSRAARWMHEQSPRAKKDFMVIDGRTHEEDSPLLHEGFIKALSKVGTLYVVEIFSLSPRMQDRLLQVLREDKVRVMGSSSSAPEFQSLPEFKEDLYGLIRHVSLRMPGLVDRQEDLEALVGHITEKIRTKQRLKFLELEKSALKKLKNQTLSGNIRTLEQIIERATAEAKAGVITEDQIHLDEPALETLLPFAIPVEGGWTRLQHFHESLEKELIIRSLQKYPKHSNTQIASILGTTRRILELRMASYHIRES